MLCTLSRAIMMQARKALQWVRGTEDVEAELAMQTEQAHLAPSRGPQRAPHDTASQALQAQDAELKAARKFHSYTSVAASSPTARNDLTVPKLARPVAPAVYGQQPGRYHMAPLNGLSPDNSGELPSPKPLQPQDCQINGQQATSPEGSGELSSSKPAQLEQPPAMMRPQGAAHPIGGAQGRRSLGSPQGPARTSQVEGPPVMLHPEAHLRSRAPSLAHSCQQPSGCSGMHQDQQEPPRASVSEAGPAAAALGVPESRGCKGSSPGSECLKADAVQPELHIPDWRTILERRNRPQLLLPAACTFFQLWSGQLQLSLPRQCRPCNVWLLYFATAHEDDDFPFFPVSGLAHHSGCQVSEKTGLQRQSRICGRVCMVFSIPEERY